MQDYKKFIVINRLKKTCPCGEVNLPYGTECDTIGYGEDKAIICDKGIVCYASSKTARLYFTQNDDGDGKERAKIVESILKLMERKDKDHQKRWDKVWDDSLCQKYKREEFEDYFLWNHDFYNAPISDLKYVAKLVGAK